MTIKVFKNLIIVRNDPKRVQSSFLDSEIFGKINQFKYFLEWHGIEFKEGRKDSYRDENGVMLESQAFILDDVNMTAYRLVKD